MRVTDTHYYVYEHRCPHTRAVVYVGSGQDARAWMHKAYAEREGGGQKRNSAHAAFLDALVADGHEPPDWVRITASGLSKEAARDIERILIAERNPIFNNRRRYQAANDNTPEAPQEVA